LEYHAANLLIHVHSHSLVRNVVIEGGRVCRTWDTIGPVVRVAPERTYGPFPCA
jgi:hypothetical protein